MGKGEQVLVRAATLQQLQHARWERQQKRFSSGEDGFVCFGADSSSIPIVASTDQPASVLRVDSGRQQVANTPSAARSAVLST